MSKVEVTISIVSYKSKDLLKNCIDSIIRSTKETDYEIVVVDNCSEDGSAELVKKHFPDVNLIENKENVGFGRAHNQSFRVSRGRYFLILNPDTIVFQEAVNKMVKFMDSNDRAGVVGCKIWWDNDKNFMFPDLRIHSLKTALFQFSPFCRFFPNSALSKWYWKSAYRLWNAKKPIEVEGITGGLMMVRRKAFEAAGMFDENFFLFFEEHDLLKRIKEAGWKIFYLPDAEIQHYFEESCRNCSFDIGKVYLESASYYYLKHYKLCGHLLIKTLLACGKMINWIEAKFARSNAIYEKVRPTNDRILIQWPPNNEAENYLVEVSYSPSFCNRGGMYVKGDTLLLDSNILMRLPKETGYIRILPILANKATGSVIKIIQISK